MKSILNLCESTPNLVLIWCYFMPYKTFQMGLTQNTIFVTGFGKTGLIAGLVKIDFFPEKASTKFKYCLRKI